MDTYLIFIFLILILIFCLKNKSKYEHFYQKKLYLYTFCVDIGRYSRENLTESLIMLVKSLDNTVKNYKLVVFKNFDIKFNHPNIIYRNYYQGELKLYKDDKWRELSFNKLNIFKDLYEEFNESFTWLDLDTIIVSDISYFNNYDNIFITNGGYLKVKNPLFKNSKKYAVSRKDYIQGNVWKINMDIYNKIVENLNLDIKPKKLILRYDLQDLFNYHIYYKNNINKYNLLGKNLKKNIIYGLSVWENPQLNERNWGDVEGVKKSVQRKGCCKNKLSPKPRSPYNINYILYITKSKRF